MIILRICKLLPFDMIAMTPGGTFRLCCVHIAQLMTHPTICTLSFTLQLCYKPPDIMQRVTKSQKVLYQVMMGYKLFIPSTLVGWRRSQGFPGRCNVAEICVIKTLQQNCSKNLKKKLWVSHPLIRRQLYMNLNTGKSHLLIFCHK